MGLGIGDTRKFAEEGTSQVCGEKLRVREEKAVGGEEVEGEGMEEGLRRAGREMT